MSLDACADLVARGDPDRFRAVMAAPLKARARLLPLFALNVEVTRAPWVTEEPMIAEMRLQWWRDALEEIAGGQPVRGHDVTTALVDVIDAESARLLDGLVAARRWDVYKDAFEDADHFDEYLNATAGTLMWVSARSLGGHAGLEAGFRDLGWAAGLASFFAAIPELEARGRTPLVDGRPKAVSALAKKGREALRRGAAAGASGPASYPAWQAAALLRQAEADPHRVSDGTLGLSEFSRRARLLRTSLSGRVPL